ncbi:hypothetical protein CDCA_CDCA01G0075 [Cyanidium caldarium]|uniref:TRAM domain-containing protein n=1 Tax=Cyanidium caldarium TaxID=2771 RepID=A0AAV9IP11_CYACA|nr:hypothetical protein CDCA_CDCA01G0075 [Cyanidium caldarium]
MHCTLPTTRLPFITLPSRLPLYRSTHRLPLPGPPPTPAAPPSMSRTPSKRTAAELVATSRHNAVDEATDQSTLAQPLERLPKRGATVDVQVSSLAYGTGLGVARLPSSAGESLVLFVRRAIPGERVRVRVVSRRRNFAEAVVVERLEPSSPFAVAPRCRHFLEGCGGCTFQNLLYAKQLEEKESQVRAIYQGLFQRLSAGDARAATAAALEQVRFEPIVGATELSEVYGYRNKMEFTFGPRRWIPANTVREESPSDHGDHQPEAPAPTDFALGLHAPRRYDKVLAIEDCALQGDVANEILRFVERRCRQRVACLPPYDNAAHTGFLRNLVIRSAVNAAGERELMVNVVTSPPDGPHEDEALRQLADEVWEAFAESGRGLVCVLQNITTTKSGVAVGEREVRLKGSRSALEQALRPLRWVAPAYLRNMPPERLQQHTVLYRISANSFFQPNPVQSEKLLARILEATGLLETASSNRQTFVVDLFCGTGSISLCVAAFAARVLGLELSESAVADARANAERNRIVNAEFAVANLDHETLWKAVQTASISQAVDVLVVDPPRAGMNPRQVRAIVEAPAAVRPRRIVYVSCNPATQVRDLEMMLAGDSPYRLRSVAPVDQFPHTPHMEAVAMLEIRDDKGAGNASA